MTSMTKTPKTLSIRTAVTAAAVALLAACGGQATRALEGAGQAIGAPPSIPTTTTVAPTTTTTEPATTTVADTVPPSTEVEAEASEPVADEVAPEPEPEPEPEQQAPAPPTTQRKKTSPAAAAPKLAPKPAATTAPAPPPTEPPAPAPTDPPEPEPTNPPPAPRPSADTSVGGAVIASVNASRKAAGLGAVSGNGTLAAIAAAHSSDQAANSQMSHTGSDGSSLGQRMARGGYGASAYGENVAAGYGSAESVMKGWMNSAGHKANILGNYTQIGVAVAYSADGTPYWTMDLAR
jgi:uncharacterized protein YkwD